MMQCGIKDQADYTLQIDKLEVKNVYELLLHQLRNFWTDVDEGVIKMFVPKVLASMKESFYGMPNKRYFDRSNSVFTPSFSIHWMIFLYRLSHELYKIGG